MAERRSGSPASSAKKRSPSGDGGRLAAREIAAAVREDLADLLGREVEAVLGIERDEDDGWIVTVAVVELQRIPSSTDVLGAYRVAVDERGELVGYRRQRRYVRSQADED